MLRKKEFYDFNYLHPLDIIRDEFNIEVSYTHIYTIYGCPLVPSKEAHRKLKRKSKTLKQLLKSEPEVNSVDRKEVIKHIGSEFTMD